MRYYIDMVISDERFFDPEGDDFSDQSAAREEAIQSLRDFLADRLRSGEDVWAHCTAEVRDETGKVLFQVAAQEMVLTDSLVHQVLDRS